MSARFTKSLIACSVLFISFASHFTFADFITESTGGGQPHNNYQPSLGLNHIIALQGTYPSRSAQASSPYIGEIQMFAGNFAPRGWALADGQLLSVSSNEALFSILGTTYGGDGRTTFGLPDLRGRTVVHQGHGPGLTSRRLGDDFGASNHTLTLDQLPSHTHNIILPVDDGTGGTTNRPFGQTLPAGGGRPHNNIQPSLAMTRYVSRTGLFPSRNGSVDGLVDGGGAGGFFGEPFLASVRTFAGNFVPGNDDGHAAAADGQILPINQNQALFSLMGTTYGGDGRTSFGLPDLRGRAVTSSGTGPGLPTHPLGETFGSENSALLSSNLPPHTHPITKFDTDTLVQYAGDGQPLDNHQPTETLNYIIRLVGTFPSRNGSVDDGSGEGGGNASVEGFIGEVALFAGNFAPRGWALANGQLLPIAQNTALFSILGTTYGGDGRNNFGLPDLRGRIPVHPDTRPPGTLNDIRLGQKFGDHEELLTLLQMPAHSHLTPVPGDADLDRDVDIVDYKIFFNALGKSLHGPSSGDFNYDGAIDGFDFSIWQEHYGVGLGNPGFVEGNPIPEPATLTLIAAVLIGYNARRQRKT